jgi:peptidoglycan hydrolase-like protein with peptidoglycan-binding domain
VSLHRLALAFLLVAPLSALGAGAFTSLHPEEAYPDPVGQPSADPYSGFITRVQEKLREAGFDGGPPNGDFGVKTQTALTQFQLSRNVPASGQLDDQTLAELGVQRDAAPASAGATTEPSASTEDKQQSEQSGDKQQSDEKQQSDSGAKPGN